MKIPLKWLRDYVDVTLPVAQLAERLSLAGLEVTGIQVVGLPVPEGVRVKTEDRGPVWDRDKIVIAQITRIDKHPDADRLRQWGLPSQHVDVLFGERRVNINSVKTDTEPRA
jgi:phenylalanyl-tRNA synthetase beta chain